MKQIPLYKFYKRKYGQELLIDVLDLDYIKTAYVSILCIEKHFTALFSSQMAGRKFLSMNIIAR